MHPYIAFEGEPSEGAALVFADTVKEAKRKAWRGVGWLMGDYTDLRVKRLRGANAEYLEQLHTQYGIDVIDDPPACGRCERWGAPIRNDGHGCGLCYE